MSPAKPVVLRAKAANDTDEAITYYLEAASKRVAAGFIQELEQAYTQISRHPNIGSARYAYELNLPGLRTWPLGRYPYLIFYIETPSEIDVWRILHQQRSIPSWLVAGN